MARDELRGRYLGYVALRRFCARMGVSVNVVKDNLDTGVLVGHAVQRVDQANYERAWKVVEEVLTDLDARHEDEGGKRERRVGGPSFLFSLQSGDPGLRGDPDPIAALIRQPRIG